MAYFVGYRLKGEDEVLVEDLRRRISEKFAVQSSLKIPPHFTLHYSFEFDDVEALKKALADFSAGQGPFSVSMGGFSCFEPKVWFIDVGHDDRAQSLRDGLKTYLHDFGITEDVKRPEPFHFHITIAYKDLTPEKFALIGAWLQHANCPIKQLAVDSITLFEKREDRWFAIRDFPFGE